MKRDIPKIVHFIWFGSSLPGWAAAHIDAFRRLNPEYEICLHGEECLLHEYAERYAALTDVCSKSDLLALSVLRKVGGWVFDTDYVPFRPIAEIVNAYQLDGKRMFVTEQHGHMNPALRIANGILAGTPDCEAWDHINRYIEASKPPYTRCRYGPEMFTELVDNYPACFTVGEWPWFYPSAIGHALRIYSHLAPPFDRLPRGLCQLAPTGGQLPFVMHLWLHGQQEIRIPKNENHLAELPPNLTGPYSSRTAVMAMMRIEWDDPMRPFPAIANALSRLGFRVLVCNYDQLQDDMLAADLLVIWNGKKGIYRSAAQEAEKSGIPVLYMEHGFFDRRRYLQIDHQGILHWASWARPDILQSPAPEGHAERLARVWPAKLEPFQHRDGYVLVLGQLQGDSQMVDSEIGNTTELERAISRTIRDVPAVYRPHPLANKQIARYLPLCTAPTLAEAIRGAKFAVTINSNSGNECLAMGCPVLCIGPALYARAGVARQTTLNELHKVLPEMIRGWRPDAAAVRNYLGWLASRQWCAEDLADGSVMAQLVAAAGVAPVNSAANAPEPELEETLV